MNTNTFALGVAHNVYCLMSLCQLRPYDLRFLPVVEARERGLEEEDAQDGEHHEELQANYQHKGAPRRTVAEKFAKATGGLLVSHDVYLFVEQRMMCKDTTYSCYSLFEG